MELKIILFGFLLLAPTFLFGSGKDSISPNLNKCKLGIVAYGIGSHSYDLTPHVTSGLTINFNIKKHTFYIGANFLNLEKVSIFLNHNLYYTSNPYLYNHDYFIYNDHFINNFGIMAGYQRYLFPMSNRLNAYLEYTFNSFTAEVANGLGQRRYTDYILTSTLGYGTKFRLYKRIYLYQSFGLGYHLALTQYPKNSHIGSAGDYIFTAKFGLGYDF